MLRFFLIFELQNLIILGQLSLGKEISDLNGTHLVKKKKKNEINNVYGREATLD